METRCAQIKDGVVINVIIADPEQFTPTDGSILVSSEDAQIYYTYNGVEFIYAPPPPQETP